MQTQQVLHNHNGSDSFNVLMTIPFLQSRQVQICSFLSNNADYILIVGANFNYYKPILSSRILETTITFLD